MYKDCLKRCFNHLQEFDLFGYFTEMKIEVSETDISIVFQSTGFDNESTGHVCFPL